MINTYQEPENVSLTQWEPNESFLHGHYDCGEINTHLDYITVPAEPNHLDSDWFFQGDEAYQMILEIHKIWIDSQEITTRGAFKIWITRYLY